MAHWPPQHRRADLLRQYQFVGQELGIGQPLLERVVRTVQITRASGRGTPILTLKHLAVQTRVPWQTLRHWVGRRGKEPYRVFRLPKRGLKRWQGAAGEVGRTICAPRPVLKRVQRHIARAALAGAATHPASVAFAPGCSIAKAAAAHCGSRWLIKIDVKGFFESISEVAVYRVFRSLGYQPLVSFELTRLCTRKAGRPSRSRQRARWRLDERKTYKIASYTLRRERRIGVPPDPVLRARREVVEDRDIHPQLVDPYGRLNEELDVLIRAALRRDETNKVARMGYLPQGAPTSPMLANLAVARVDRDVQALADAHGLSYTRYADDMAFSTPSRGFSYDAARDFVRRVYAIFARWGFRPNLAKTRIRGPGSRKVVLGLGVDAHDRPRLPRELRDRMRMHFHYIQKLGPATHAKNRGFPTVLALRRHVEGLLFFARDVDKRLGDAWLRQYNSVRWPV